MENVCWITGSSFIDVDISLIPDINKKINLYWIVILQKESFYSYEQMKHFMEEHNIHGSIIIFKNRLRSIKTFFQYLKTVFLMKSLKSDIYYIDYLGLPYFFPLILLNRITKSKIIYPCHDFVDHVSIPNRKMIMKYKKMIFKNFKNFQFFSKTQNELFCEKYIKKNTFQIPLNLKGFGDSNKVPDTNKIVFLFFGTIRKNKGLETLIKAVNLIDSKYNGKYVVRIYGFTSEWESYEHLMENKSVYDLKIQRIENEEIPDIFKTSHYLVLPYHDVTQSGPLLISYNYRIPVIASDLPGFREYIENTKTGFLFELDNSKALAQVLTNILENNNEMYGSIHNSLNEFISKNISTDILVDKYIDMFKKVKNEIK